MNIDRIKEPSSYAGMGLIIATLASLVDGSIDWTIGVPTIFASLGAIFAPELGPK